MAKSFDALVGEVRRCTLCADQLEHGVKYRKNKGPVEIKFPD